MSRPQVRLENELARAKELIAIDRHEAAFDHILQSLLLLTHHSNTAALDEVMKCFVDLGVQLKKGKLLKDGIFAYRTLMQNVSIPAVEALLLSFLDRCDDELAKAQENIQKPPNADDEDFEADYSPEALLALAYEIAPPSSSDERDRLFRSTVTPWLRFTWESYRTVLDCVRNNSRFEPLYEQVGTRAICFCVQNRRPAEFRRLADIFRYHMSITVRYPSQPFSINLSASESHQRQLDLRFALLSGATDLGLWQEGFRIIEDIHGVFLAGRRNVRLALPASYYDKIAQIFSSSQSNPLFLAATWHRILQLSRAGKEDAAPAATMAILTTLAIPSLRALDCTNHMTSEERHAKASKLASFIGLHKPPTRFSLLGELREKNAFGVSDVKWLRELYDLLFHGPKASDSAAVESWIARVTPLVEQVKSLGVSAFLAAGIYRNALTRAIQVVISHHDSITFTELQMMLKAPIHEIEAIIVHGCHTGDFQARIDQASGTIRFDRTRYLLVSAEQAAATAQASVRAPLRLDGWNFLLSQVDELLVKLKIERQAPPIEKARKSLLASLGGRLRGEHAATLDRLQGIRQEREELAAQAALREKEEAKVRAARQAAEQAAIQQRIADENARREAERLSKEREDIRKEEARKADEERSRMQAIATAKVNFEKIISSAKRADYLERAIRQEEHALLAEDAKRQAVGEKEAWETKMRQIRDIAAARHKADMEIKAKLPALQADRDAFKALVQSRRQAAHDKQATEAGNALKTAKEARRAEVAAKHEAEVKRIEEVEKQRLRLEQEAAERSQLAESLARQQAIQRQKEEEIEKRVAAERAQAPASQRDAFAVFGTKPKASASAHKESPTAPPSTKAPSGSWRK